MGPIRLMWWRFLMDLRPMIRYGAERFPHLAAPGVRLRAIAHFAAGNPLHLFIMIYGCIVWAIVDSYPIALIAWFSGFALVEIGFQLIRIFGGWPIVVWLLGWREAWRVRRRWPADWAIVAAKTTRVQAEVGTSNEPIASASLRPVADHPKMSWLPRIQWPVISWWVGPPPGRSFDSLDEVSSQLAANMSHCIDVTVEFDRESDSCGRLVVTFADPLRGTVDPPTEIDIAAELKALPPADPVPDTPDDEPPSLHLVETEWQGF